MQCAPFGQSVEQQSSLVIPVWMIPAWTYGSEHLASSCSCPNQWQGKKTANFLGIACFWGTPNSILYLFLPKEQPTLWNTQRLWKGRKNRRTEKMFSSVFLIGEFLNYPEQILGRGMGMKEKIY